MEDKIIKVFNDVWREQKNSEPPHLNADTVLLETDLDSLGLAILVTRLEEELGYDPFSISEEAIYPQTFGEFSAFYTKHKPVQC